ncbi:hypothetical protein TSUD_51620 [Trifolium subterraneum]|uniref:DNL-type domain-containing protein n=1 Tax=Trifolium subterraneum TaxID=3900 RepID=A0A2Z6LP32_TRISU|nr:hypothetical protein TSUD_51620 [Trifolium subterraneum]
MIMESLSSSSSTALPSFSIFPSTTPSLSSKKTLLHFRPPSSKRDDGKDSESQSKSKEDTNNMNLPIRSNNRCFSISPLSNDAAMGLVLSAATGRGWTTGSGMEGPPVPAVGKDDQSGGTVGNISTFPWSLFTKSPRRRMLIAFTCTICSQRTTRAINPHAYTDGTVFVQCCGCNAYHKLVDHLNLFQETNCYLNSSFNYKGPGWEDVKFMDIDSDDDDDIFPVT